MKVLIFHNVLWAHYKSILFDELYNVSQQVDDFELLVCQIAKTEKSRLAMGNFDTSTIKYPYELIHDGIIEEVSLSTRTKGMINAIAKFKPDVVNVAGYYDLAFWAVTLYCKVKGIKVILSNESTANDHVRSTLRELLKKIFVSQMNGFFNFGSLSSLYMVELGAKPEQQLVNKSCVDNDTIRLIYNQEYAKGEQRKRQLHLSKHNFIFVGRLIPFKNLAFLLQAFKQAKAKCSSEWGLIILGDGEQKSELASIVSDEKIQDVTFLPGVGWKEVPAYLALSDVLVLASYSEPWGLVVNEAMVCGMPVLVSESCGCAPDLVQNGKNGFTFNPHSIESLIEKLVYFMSNSDQIPTMGMVSEEIINSYTPKTVAEEMYAAFKKVLNK